MFTLRMLAAGLIAAAVCAGQNPVVGKWSCTNVPDTGEQRSWTLLIRQDGTLLTGSLTDGDVEIALTDVKAEGGSLRFRFAVNDKPYTFEGKVEQQTLAGRYSGEEASGKLTCAKPAS